MGDQAKPLGIDLFCGLGGWTAGMLAEGYDVVGFDIERHVYGDACYPAQLVLQDVLTLDGAQFKDAALIVASPPCQAYSYRAMPWKRARSLPPPDNALFDACFRIQLEASAAAGRHVPLIVENVKGAQPWVGRARWHYGSFYLWGDVPALMPMAHGLRTTKNAGGSWFAVAHNTGSGHGQNPDGRKNPGQNWSRYRETGETSPHWNVSGIKHSASGAAWFDSGASALPSNSSRRRAASALMAKIPMPLARHIAAVYHPGKSASAHRGKGEDPSGARD